MAEQTWRVDLVITQNDGCTTARATLVGDGSPVVAVGQAHRSSVDVNAPDLGPEVAAARALRLLADTILATASGVVGEIENVAAALQ
jgi:hypothetical protein